MALRICLACGITLLISLSRSTAQESAGPEGAQADVPPTATIPPEVFSSDCVRCHFCNRPSPEDPCLFSCTKPRPTPDDLGSLDQPSLAMIILDELEDAYLPVPFDHKGHAEMAEMTQGCATCHHFTPAGGQHPACKTCHAISDAQADIDKPSLLGAYHQQCLNCHREWINERDCDVCHRPKAGGPAGGEASPPPTRDDILRVMHPPIPEPDAEFYRIRSEGATETQVIFRHREHTQRFGLTCVECHHESSCAHCHNAGDETTRPRTFVEHHRQCIRCHKRDMDVAGWQARRCERCHWREDTPKPGLFDHAGTGWPLSRFHQGKSCRVCHEELPFTKLSRDCNACHADWAPAAFDHRVTGQALDENHAEQDCEVCHPERRFDRPPKCDECHDPEDDGIAFPARRPGPVVQVEPAEAAAGAGPG